MRSLWMLGGLVAGAMIATPAVAGKKDDAWAQCIWGTVPFSASNWLNLPLPKNRYGLSDVPPEYILQFRLQAACYDKMTPTGKTRPLNFDPRRVRASLLAFKLTVIGEDMVDPKAYRCTRFFLNDTERETPAGYDWGFGDTEGAPQFFSVTYMFAAKGGGTVGLPQTGGLRECEYIQADGSFRRA